MDCYKIFLVPRRQILMNFLILWHFLFAPWGSQLCFFVKGMLSEMNIILNNYWKYSWQIYADDNFNSDGNQWWLYCVGMWLLNRQRQVQGGQGEGRRSTAAAQQAGGDQRLPCGWCGVWKAEVQLMNEILENDFDVCCQFFKWIVDSKHVLI